MTDHASLTRHARAMRREMTIPERSLWQRLRNRQLDGWKFRRQHPMPPWISDFACVEARLLIELDGETHISTEVDARRDEANAARGYRTLRFGNREVLEDIEGVLEIILRALSEPLPHRRSAPLPPAGEEW